MRFGCHPAKSWVTGAILSGVNYFFGLTTTISSAQRQLLLVSSVGQGRSPAAVRFLLWIDTTRRGSCGNVEIAPLLRDFQGRWEGWKTWGWFSRLSTAPAFPQLSFCAVVFVLVGSSVFALAFRLLILLCVFHAVTGDIEFDDHAMVHQPINGGRRHHRTQGPFHVSTSAPPWLVNCSTSLPAGAAGR